MSTTHFLAGLILVGTAAALSIPDASISGPARVIDGDTLQIADHRIRLWGIDAPERTQTCNNTACGLAATAFLQKIVLDKYVTCYQRDKDKYGRIVATCETVQGDIGQRMVANGHAIDYARYSRGHYRDEEAAAREQRLGIWAGPFITPEKFRADQRRY